jgi:23S rRNA pseudouridine1911/1915/1917 synthase
MQNKSKEIGTAPLLEWVLRQFPDTPKSRAKEWVLAGRVSVNGAVIRKPHQVIEDPNDGLQLGNRHASTLDCGSGWQIHPRVTLLHLDSDLAVVNKGPGVISVPAGDGEISALSILADFIVGKLKSRGRILPPPYRRLEPLPVHRLDQYTSGVFCMATNPAARHHLIEQLRVRTMKREYVAFVEGRFDQPKGTWQNWLQLSRDELRQHVITDAQAKAAGDEARPATTHYEVIAEYPIAEGKGFVTKLRLRLESGRKHQIRAQAAHAGHPLVGDRVYNREGSSVVFPRQALHAEVLELEHPGKNHQRMKWIAELPKDLRQLEGVLRQPTPR